MLVYKVDFNTTIIDYKGAITAIVAILIPLLHHKQLAN